MASIMLFDSDSIIFNYLQYSFERSSLFVEESTSVVAETGRISKAYLPSKNED